MPPLPNVCKKANSVCNRTKPPGNINQSMVFRCAQEGRLERQADKSQMNDCGPRSSAWRQGTRGGGLEVGSPDSKWGKGELFRARVAQGIPQVPRVQAPQNLTFGVKT